jgi:hypothetical protein
MSVSKFRFVSPGVQVNEIDNSQLPKSPTEIGPVIIGRSLRGPIMRPVRVNSFSDFVDVFGEPVAGGQGGDVWREGNQTTPTYAAYAAQAYLKNTSPVTFVRLGGYQNLGPAAETGLAGWDVANAYGLFIAPTYKTGSNQRVEGTASLAAIIYSDSSVGLVGSSLSTNVDDVINKEATWVKIDDANFATRLVVNGQTASVNFDKNSKKYIRNVLNVNPTAYGDKNYFLGESFLTSLQQNTALKFSADKNSTQSAAAILLKLDGYQNFKQEAVTAETGWIIAQHLGASGSYANTTGSAREYVELQKLFKIVSLTEGEWNSQNLKVSIEDIKGPINEYVKYGTFTLSIRKASDSDTRPEYLERFSGLTLDPSSENYIAKRIGDKSSAWDYSKRQYTEFGTYDSNSKFVRVEMNLDVDAGKTNPSLLPFGYYGPLMYAAQTVTGSGTAGDALSTVLSMNNHITGAAAYTASFAMPKLQLLSSNSDSSVSSYSALYWGAMTTVSGTRKENADYKDFVRATPADFGANTVYQYLFSLDDVSASLAGTGMDATIVEASGASWTQNNRASGSSVTANPAVSGSGVDVLLKTFNKFTVPLAGGFDGLDVTQPNPFANSILNAPGANHTNNYAYNSVKVAIESIADSEVVEMNLATIPGVTNVGLNSQLIEKCELRGDALAIVDLLGDYNPETKAAPDVSAAIESVKEYANTSYGCAYFPWVLIKDTINNNKVWVPSSVVALGTFASSERKTELWFAPAGFNRGGLSDGSAGLPVLQTALRLNSKDRDALYESNINPIATFPAEGIVIFGQKTLQVTPSALDRINVRRLMIYLKKEISRMASTILFDPNIQVTWKRFLDKANPFLASVQSRFGLSEYRVILDETTTTPDLVDRNIVYAKILLKPTRAIEFIGLDFVISNTGASFAD